MNNKLIFILTGIILLVLFVASKTIITRPLPIIATKTNLVEFPDGYTISSWVWKSPDELSTEEIAQMLTYANREKINTLYIDMNKYLDLIEENNANRRNEGISKFESALKILLMNAKQHNVLIEAVAGDVKWSNSSHSYIPPLLLNYVFTFNKRYPNIRFSGMQFDIEYYNQEGYKDSKDSYNSDFLELVRNLSSVVKRYDDKTSNNFRIGFAIPYWLDTVNADNILNQLLDELNKVPNSYIAIMSYRNYVNGENGTQELVDNELNYTSEKARNVSVIVGQEVGMVDTPNTSFYGKNKQELKKAVNLIVSNSIKYQTFSGIAIDSFYSYRDLKDR